MKRLIWLVILVCLAAFIPPASAERLEDDTLMTFYDDTIFFGDSRMESLRRYILSIRETDEEFMKKTKLICVGGIGLYAASRNYLSGAFLFSYAGVELTMFEAAEKFHPKRVFILLGLNDEVGVKVDKAITWVEDILRRMEEMAPDTEVYFFSETPVTEKYEIKENLKDYQKALDRYNAALKETCEQNGAFYIEIAETFKDENNYLSAEYTGDKECHLSEEGNALLIQKLKDYAQERYDLGLWDPFAGETGTAGGK